MRRRARRRAFSHAAGTIPERNTPISPFIGCSPDVMSGGFTIDAPSASPAFRRLQAWQISLPLCWRSGAALTLSPRFALTFPTEAVAGERESGSLP